MIHDSYGDGTVFYGVVSKDSKIPTIGVMIDEHSQEASEEIILLREQNAELMEALSELTEWARDIAGDVDDDDAREREWKMMDRMDALMVKHRGE